MRPLPELTAATEWFWTSGADGRLRIQGCTACGSLVHPPVPICPNCRSTEWQPTVVSGRGSVVGFTVNQHRWHPAFDPPYVIAVVAVAEDPTVRLTTSIVGCDPADVHVGQDVEVRFEHVEDVWLPLFEPTGGADVADPIGAPARPVPRPPLHADRFEHRAAISGVGRSAVGRRLMVDPLSLTVDACLKAVADAGLQLGDIDGLSTYPGPVGMGMSEGGVTAVEEALRLHPTWINGGMEIPGQGGALIAAMLAVASGLCRHVLCFRTVWESTFAALGHGAAGGGGRCRGPVGLAHPVRGVLRGELDRHERQPVPAPLRRAAGDARADRVERAGQRGAQPGGHLPGPHDDGRLPRGAAHHDPLRPLRLRRPL